MSITLKMTGLFGFVFFCSLFSLTFISYDKFEESAKDFIKFQIEKEVQQKQHSMSESTVAEAALNIAQKLGIEKE
uniref:hypothetical protein n=1 Tax=Thaumasiovibrio subtropicus TaxID=1891207 RepID=UPI000B35ED35|nr:hypothetical protein [Thaumasiovibrio subtropicus]